MDEDVASDSEALVKAGATATAISRAATCSSRSTFSEKRHQVATNYNKRRQQRTEDAHASP